MADKYAQLGLQLATPLVQNYDSILDKGREHIEKITRRRTTREKGQRSYGYDDNRRSSVGSYGSERGRGKQRRRGYAGYSSDSGSDSEASIPPRNRRRATSARDLEAGRGQQQGPRSNGYGRYSDSYSYTGSDSKGDSSTDTSDLPSSTDDEREERKRRRNELLTGGIAAVATLHAAANIYGSMKAREARKKSVKEGDMTEKQAKVEDRKNKMQDVAALGLAALSLKGAYGKWQGTVHHHKSLKEHRQERHKRHLKRLEKGMSRQNRSRGQSFGSTGAGTVTTTNNNNNNGYSYNQQRPGYNRGYSRSENDLPRSNKYRTSSSRSGGGGGRKSSRYGNSNHNNYGGYDEDWEAGGGDD